MVSVPQPEPVTDALPASPFWLFRHKSDCSLDTRLQIGGAHDSYPVDVHAEVSPASKLSAKMVLKSTVQTLGTPGSVTTSTKKFENEPPSPEVSQWNDSECEPPSLYPVMSTYWC